MLNIVEKSFCFSFMVKFFSFFSDSFKKSVFKNFLIRLKAVFKTCETYKVIKNYFDKSPYFFNSVLYRGIKFTGRRTSKSADKLNDFIIRIYSGSFIDKIISFYKSEDTADKFTAAGLFFMVVSLSYLIFSVIFGINYEYRIFVSWGLFFLGILTVSAGKNIESVKMSFTYRIVKYIVELVKM